MVKKERNGKIMEIIEEMINIYGEVATLYAQDNGAIAVVLPWGERKTFGNYDRAVNFVLKCGFRE